MTVTLMKYFISFQFKESPVCNKSFNAISSESLTQTCTSSVVHQEGYRFSKSVNEISRKFSLIAMQTLWRLFTKKKILHDICRWTNPLPKQRTY